MENRSDNMQFGPGADVPGPEVPSWEQLTLNAGRLDHELTALERGQWAKTLLALRRALDLSEIIAISVDVYGQSVASFARKAAINVRRATDIYKLAAIADDIRKEIEEGIERYGEDYQPKSWKQYVPKTYKTISQHEKRLKQIVKEVAKLEKAACDPDRVEELKVEQQEHEEAISYLKTKWELPPWHQSNRDDWPTRRHTFDWITATFAPPSGFDLDVCA